LKTPAGTPLQSPEETQKKKKKTPGFGAKRAEALFKRGLREDKKSGTKYAGATDSSRRAEHKGEVKEGGGRGGYTGRRRWFGEKMIVPLREYHHGLGSVRGSRKSARIREARMGFRNR